MKKFILFLFSMFIAVTAMAQIETSTSVENPEHMYTIKSSAGHYMTSYTSPTAFYPGLSCCCYCVASELSRPGYMRVKILVAPLRVSNVCDDGNFSSPKECVSAPQPTEVCCLRFVSKASCDC